MAVSILVCRQTSTMRSIAKSIQNYHNPRGINGINTENDGFPDWAKRRARPNSSYVSGAFAENHEGIKGSLFGDDHASANLHFFNSELRFAFPHCLWTSLE